MPRKKVKGKPVTATGTELKSVRLELTPETHKELRVEAAKRDQSMAALVRNLVEDFLSKLPKHDEAIISGQPGKVRVPKKPKE